jgi:hypothetical protein
MGILGIKLAFCGHVHEKWRFKTRSVWRYGEAWALMFGLPASGRETTPESVQKVARERYA